MIDSERRKMYTSIIESFYRFDDLLILADWFDERGEPLGGWIRGVVSGTASFLIFDEPKKEFTKNGIVLVCESPILTKSSYLDYSHNVRIDKVCFSLPHIDIPPKQFRTDDDSYLTGGKSIEYKDIPDEFLYPLAIATLKRTIKFGLEHVIYYGMSVMSHNSYFYPDGFQNDQRLLAFAELVKKYEKMVGKIPTDILKKHRVKERAMAFINHTNKKLEISYSKRGLSKNCPNVQKIKESCKRIYRSIESATNSKNN